MLKELLKEMFEKVTIEKNSDAIPHYYHPEFVMITNQQEMSYEAFYTSHLNIYGSSIDYSILYDEQTFVEQFDRVACRVWITTKRQNEAAVEIEVMLIAQYRDGKIYRLWELTFPDWSKLPAFQ